MNSLSENLEIDKEEAIRGWLRVLILVIPYIFVVVFFQFFGALLVGIDYTEEVYKEHSYQDFVILVFGNAGTFLILWIFMKYVDKESFVKLGFQVKGRWNDFVLGFLVGMVIMMMGFLILILSKDIAFEKIHMDEQEMAILFALFILVSVGEEVLIRGYVLKNFMLSFNKYFALIVSSLLFSIMHGFNPHFDFIAFVNLFLAGLVLGISYIYSKNLWFPIGMHLSWNFFQSILGFNVSGMDKYSLLVISMDEPNRINGGLFGLEGSYFVTFASIISIFLLANFFSKKEKQQIGMSYR
ncbi:CPBP family intramembrane glutamic endopeptidase [Cecembia rubra]|uniref:CPBP family intramembrane glutamic endopeptidase n=1 Tax=Cecembia rubra TaxID=1485585 RepID=UPI0027151818|nr:CPBP family intramembrane glutamic endopeptidase [Cecembia rubra]